MTTQPLRTLGDPTAQIDFGGPLTLHPSLRPEAKRCRVCERTYPRLRGVTHQLCPDCVANAPTVLAAVDAHLAEAAQHERTVIDAWCDRTAGLVGDLRKRWDALVDARAEARLVLHAAERGPRPRSEPETSRQVAQDKARHAYAAVLQKIERTRAASPEIAELLSAEAAMETALHDARSAVARWEMARADLESLTEDMPL